MKFELEGYIEFSENVDFLSAKMPELVAKEINTQLFRKGVPPQQEGARLISWSFSLKKMFLTIEGTTYLRPHDALLRLRTYFSEKLGKENKIGVRKIFIKKYLISFKPQEMPNTDIKVNVPWVKKISKENDQIVLELQDLDSTAIEDRYVERIIRRIEEKIRQSLYGGKAEHWELLWKSKEKEPVWKENPTSELEKRGWIKKFDVGVWWHGTFTTKLMRTFQTIAEKEILKPLKFQEIILPKTTPLEVWLKTGHVPGSSNSFYYVCRPETWDPNFWEDFSDYVKVTGKIPYDMLKSKIANPTAGICFAQCPPFYWYFEKKLIPDEDLPIKVYDNSGVSYRWEGGGLHGLERDSEFHRIELIWMGTKEQVIEIKDKLIEAYKRIFNDILDLEWRMAWVTPWYMQQAGQIQTEEDKVKGTIDFEAWLPWRGEREKSEWLEFQNLTIAGTKFSDAWDFKTKKGNEVWTGCSGIGLERWMVVFLSQKGIDPEKWPKQFSKIFGSMPKPIRVL
jgi:seryl-tRNA synthetase